MNKLPIKVEKVTLQTMIHVIPNDLSYNLLLGRPWLHEMHVVPSTLHCIMKYVYNKKIYTIIVDIEPYDCLKIEIGKGTP